MKERGRKLMPSAKLRMIQKNSLNLPIEQGRRSLELDPSAQGISITVDPGKWRVFSVSNISLFFLNLRTTTAASVSKEKL